MLGFALLWADEGVRPYISFDSGDVDHPDAPANTSDE
jgi:hypothetical protein